MNRNSLMCFIVFTIMSMTACSRGRGPAITQAELVRRTQEIFDAVGTSNRAPFEKYFAADCMVFDEKGRSMDKKAFVADQSPLPPGFSGAIRLVNPQSRVLGDVAVLSYDLNETETIFGQNMWARYHATDTWVRRNGQWKIVAEQVLRYYEDPAPARPEIKKYPEYTGTYELAPGITLTVSAEGKDLYSQRAGRARELLVPEAPDIFFRQGVEGRRLFRRNDKGKVDALIDRRNNEDVVWRKIK
ncbi:MAG TPA: DUF4440 domain-containing protein [Terriglobales bacterium]|nr:DUF4440 domain-containing protein [Terriglobales bacterium]